MVRRETAGREIERRVGEGQRGRIGLRERGVRGGHDARAPGLDHLERRVRTDRERDERRDAPQRVAHAAAEVERTLAAPGRSDGDEPLEVLTRRVRRARHVRGGRPAELRACVFHSSFSNSTVVARV